MTPYAPIHDQLLDRALELARRLERLEGEIEHQRGVLGPAATSLRETTPLVGELIDTAHRELADIRASLRRIATDEYGACAKCGVRIPLDRLELQPHATACPRCDPGGTHSAAAPFHAEHLGLRSLLGSLQGLVASLASESPGAAASHAAALAIFADLERELLHHFEREEEGGYLSQALAVAPHHARLSESLLEDHARFRRDSARLHEQARRAGDSAEAWRVLDVEFAAFAGALLEHEEAETEIIADAFVHDSGGRG